jgi:hypothetical protein
MSEKCDALWSDVEIVLISHSPQTGVPVLCGISQSVPNDKQQFLELRRWMSWFPLPADV